jgi:hypothetical protein
MSGLKATALQQLHQLGSLSHYSLSVTSNPNIEVWEVLF